MELLDTRAPWEAEVASEGPRGCYGGGASDGDGQQLHLRVLRVEQQPQCLQHDRDVVDTCHHYDTLWLSLIALCVAEKMACDTNSPAACQQSVCSPGAGVAGCSYVSHTYLWPYASRTACVPSGMLRCSFGVPSIHLHVLAQARHVIGGVHKSAARWTMENPSARWPARVSIVRFVRWATANGTRGKRMLTCSCHRTAPW